MNQRRDSDDTYDPRAVMARVAHLPPSAQEDVERISRIVRACFGYGRTEAPDHCRILSVALIGPLGDPRCAGTDTASYDLRVVVNFPDCADDSYLSFAKRIIASEFGECRPVTLTIEPEAADESSEGAIVLYDAQSDAALNARELFLSRRVKPQEG